MLAKTFFIFSSFLFHIQILYSQYVFNNMYDYNNVIEAGTTIQNDDTGRLFVASRFYWPQLDLPDYGSSLDSTIVYVIDKNGKLEDNYRYQFSPNHKEYAEGMVLKGDTLVLVISSQILEEDNLKIAFISKSDGTLLDTISIPSTGANYSTRDFIRARDGGFLGCGWKSYTPESNVMKTIVYKLTINGELEWMREFKHPDFERQNGASIVELDSGEIFVACQMVDNILGDVETSWSVVKLNLEGDSLKQALYLPIGEYSFPNCIKEDSSYNILIGGVQEEDGKILRIDSSLNLLDEYTYQSSFSEFVVVDLFSHYENFYGTLHLDISTDSSDPYNIRMGLAKFDADFNMLWYKVYSGMEDQDDQYYYDAVQTDDGGIAMCGFIITGTDEVNNMWLVKTDSLGNDTLPLSNILPEHLYLTVGDDTTLTAITYGGSNCYQHYEWSCDGLPFYIDEADSMKIHLLAAEPGDYECIYYTEDISGPGIYDTCRVHVWSVGTSTALSSRTSTIQVMPNPVRDYLSIQHKDNVPISRVVIYTMDGREVMDRAYKGGGIDVSSLVGGLYFIEVVADDGVAGYGRFVKE